VSLGAQFPALFVWAVGPSITPIQLALSMCWIIDRDCPVVYQQIFLQLFSCSLVTFILDHVIILLGHARYFVIKIIYHTSYIIRHTSYLYIYSPFAICYFFRTMKYSYTTQRNTPSTLRLSHIVCSSTK